MIHSTTGMNISQPANTHKPEASTHMNTHTQAKTHTQTYKPQANTHSNRCYKLAHLHSMQPHTLSAKHTCTHWQLHIHVQMQHHHIHSQLPPSHLRGRNTSKQHTHPFPQTFPILHFRLYPPAWNSFITHHSPLPHGRQARTRPLQTLSSWCGHHPHTLGCLHGGHPWKTLPAPFRGLTLWIQQWGISWVKHAEL